MIPHALSLSLLEIAKIGIDGYHPGLSQIFDGGGYLVLSLS